mmetsp:Transcript_106864/g.312400  ORF Transcript_106864/g.312400 Transcript_106864/m.312400 type:complete len:85 (-) Transcript_106864:405-659(-)
MKIHAVELFETGTFHPGASFLPPLQERTHCGESGTCRHPLGIAITGPPTAYFHRRDAHLRFVSEGRRFGTVPHHGIWLELPHGI